MIELERTVVICDFDWRSPPIRLPDINDPALLWRYMLPLPRSRFVLELRADQKKLLIGAALQPALIVVSWKAFDGLARFVPRRHSTFPVDALFFRRFIGHPSNTVDTPVALDRP